eukprot:2703682-Rhodomonas_salina.3
MYCALPGTFAGHRELAVAAQVWSNAFGYARHGADTAYEALECGVLRAGEALCGAEMAYASGSLALAARSAVLTLRMQLWRVDVRCLIASNAKVL